MSTYSYLAHYPGERKPQLLVTNVPLQFDDMITNVQGGPFQVTFIDHEQTASGVTQAHVYLKGES